jgi:cell fate (sporulation/competence/biofilm development) regulator YlbF (YheA/YmcA/DUF963 family)
MQSLISSNTIEGCSRELCQAILDDPVVQDARREIEGFFADDDAKAVYGAWQEWAHELHSRGHQGLKPSEDDLAQLQSLEESVKANPVAARFGKAEQHLNAVFGGVTTLVQKTLQLGRIPTEEDLSKSGCCGSGGGCGCSH